MSMFVEEFTDYIKKSISEYSSLVEKISVSKKIVNIENTLFLDNKTLSNAVKKFKRNAIEVTSFGLNFGEEIFEENFIGKKKKINI